MFGSRPARDVPAICENGGRTERPVRRRHVACAASGCGFACPRSCDGEAGSSTTPLRDEQRHMAPLHRLAVGLPDQRGWYAAAIRSTWPIRNYVDRVKGLPRRGLVQCPLSHMVRGAKVFASVHFLLASIRRGGFFTSCAAAARPFRAEPSRA